MQTPGVRTYLMEFSYANAQFMNKFLETGDPATLNFVLGQMWGFADCSEERRHFFVELRKWNLTLPPTERVRVVGFDLERMPGVSLEFLRRQFTGLTPPGSIREVIERLRALPEKPEREEVVLFTLTGRKSPFARERLLPNEATDGLTTNYFQYAVLIKAAVAATPASLNPAKER